MLCVDDYSYFETIRFLKKCDTTAALKDVPATQVIPAGMKIGIARTDGGGEFEGEFQHLINKLGIKPERTPPHTP